METTLFCMTTRMAAVRGFRNMFLKVVQFGEIFVIIKEKRIGREMYEI